MGRKRVDIESFEEWKGSPIGELFFGAMAKEVERSKQAWLSASWEGGRADPLLLHSLKERAVFAQQVAGVTADKLEDMLSYEE